MSVRAVKIEVLHGVNLDQLGRRDPAHYGALTLMDLEGKIRSWAVELGVSVSFFQTNHEGELVEHLHRLRDSGDGVILNPGAWTHYSWALRDALELTELPAVEVHLSKVEEREEFRRISVLDGLVRAKISGKGPDGYREALELLVKELAG